MQENTSFLPVYTASPEQNSGYIRQMLPLMLKHNIPVDPINYAVWYHYVAGINGDLNNAVDNLIRDQKPFDFKTSLNLYKTYICNATVDSFERINSRLLRLITETTMSVTTTSEKVSAAGDNFHTKLNELISAENTAHLKSTLIEIILETTQLTEASKALKNQLDNTNKEIEQLQNELSHVHATAQADGLTGLLNRHAFDKTLAELIGNAATQNACLAILDLDHFKRINDSFGHLVGDKVIKYFASLMKKHTAKHHHVARYGGEEMAIIMPDTTLPEAFNVIDQIRRALDKSSLSNKNDTETIGKITVSAGIASLKVVDTADTLIDRADKALYRAKNTGRNRIVTENALSLLSD
ncbi:MAG: GGDEF domain-containing protein [Methylococcales bacterium]|nr:GGDEF domain-containing protein [Methylococcales bacterium]